MSVKYCPNCKAELATNALQGLCPACLLEKAMLKPRSTSDPAETSDHRRSFTAPTIEELNARFPQLEIQELLGQGGMGAVYKARQRVLDRVVALKILPPEINRDPAFAERFTREARALAKLAHPNIVTVFEFGEQDGLYFLLMEFVDGVNLRESIQSGAIAPAAALAVVSQICDALQYAHDEGVVHRDIKPENVLLDKRGRVKIADFGLAKLLGLSPIEVTLTATHQVMGTLHYMAPEQLERPLEVDHRADIYSLGVVFYELLTGELPLGRYKLPSEKRKLDVRLDDVVLRTLEREPQRRYQHVSEVKTEVDHISSSNLTPQSHQPKPAQQGPTIFPGERLPTVPFVVTKHGMTLTDGVLRADREQVVLEFDVPQKVASHTLGAGLKAGLQDIAIRLDDISTVRLESGWFKGILVIQTDSVRNVAGIPGADRGRASLEIAAEDIATADLFVRGIGRRISGQATIESENPKESPTSSFHPGLFGLGVVMILTGAAMFSVGLATGHPGYLWIGLGLVLGGGATAGAPSIIRKDGQSSVRRAGPQLGMLIMAMVFAIMGSALLIIGFATKREEFVWIGLGITLGGGGLWCVAWLEEKSKDVDADRQQSLSPQLEKPLKPETLAKSESGGDYTKLKIPAIGLCVSGLIDVMAMSVVIGFAIYMVSNPKHGLLLPGALELLIIGSGAIFGVVRLVAGISMLTRRSHSLATISAIFGSLPCGGAWILGMPFGIWSLIVLNSHEARHEFELAAKLREEQAWECDDD